MDKTLKFLISVLITVVSCGCATYGVNVNSYSRSDFSGKKFQILINRQIENDLEFEEFATMVSRALKISGFGRSLKQDESPDMKIIISYGISGPQKSSRSSLMPIYNIPSTSTIKDRYGQTLATVKENPGSFSPIGYQSIVTEETNFKRFLIVSAFSADAKAVLLWRTEVTSKGSSGDLREVFPYLVSAGSKYFGRNTGRIIEIDLSEADSLAEKLRESRAVVNESKNLP